MRLYKYATANTAKAILETGTLRWSSPFMFNDPFDVQFDLHVEFDDATIVTLIADELWELYCGRKTLEPSNAFGRVLRLFLTNEPGLTKDELFGRQGLSQAIRESITRTKELLPDLQETQRSVLAGAKILCFSEVYDSLLMWSHYAENHTGAVLEFEASEEGDSALKKAERIRYSAKMPRLMTEQGLVQFFSGQARLNPNAVMHDSIYVKASDWSYEKEWRIWLANTDVNQQFIDLEFDATDFLGIKFGCRMSDEYRKVLLKIIGEKYPNATTERASKSAREFSLEFEPVAK
jgi:hypothetical protein